MGFFLLLHHICSDVECNVFCILLRFHRITIYLTFTFMSTLADAMRSMDVSRSPDSLISYSRFPYHVPPARVLVRFPSHFTCSLTCTNMDWRLVSGYLFVLHFSFCLVDSSLCLPLPLMLTRCSLSIHDSWTLTRLQLVFPLWTFVIVSCSPLYIRLEMRTCSPSSIYFATTLKVWPARSHELSSSSLVRWPRLLLCDS